MKKNQCLSFVWIVIVLVTLVVGATGCAGTATKTPEAAQPAEPTSPAAPAATQAETPAVEQPTTEAHRRCSQQAEAVSRSSSLKTHPHY